MIPLLAFRGALKHWRRSLVVIGAVAVSCGVMVTIGSLLAGISGGFHDSVIPGSGHVRIDDAEAPRAVNPLGLGLLLPDARDIVRRVEELGDPRIASVEPVLGFGALLIEDLGEGDPRNLPMRAIALEPDTVFADNVRGAMTAGEFLPGGEGILLSESAARLVGAGLGAGLLVLVQDRSGQPWYERLTVTGLFRTESADFDETTFYLGIGKAADMLDTPGAAREIRLLLRDRNEAEAVAGEVAGILAAERGGGRALRVLPWQTINASIFVLLLFVKVLLYVIMGLFAVVAATIIANGSLVSVMERVREFGTMRALGLRARVLERLILLEGAMLGLAGALVGLALGSLVVALLSRGGVDLGGMMESLGLSRFNRPRAEAGWYLACAALSLLVCVGATARAARAVRSMGVAESLAKAA